MATIRDKLWMWGHNVGAHDPDTTWKLPKPSRMTPVEGAYYMGVPNMIFVWLWRAEAPEPLPSWEQYAIPFRALKNVVWSISGGHGLSYVDRAFALAAANPNFSGVMMDDFFTAKPDGQIASLSDAELDDVRRRIVLPDRRLDLWACVYEIDLEKPIAPVMAGLDVIMFATWKTENLPRMAENFAAMERLAPDKRKVLLLYMWDYPNRKPLPIEAMQAQCELALQWLREGRIEGLVFLATCICDLELETVEWTRRWIASVADEEI
jgi:hypothetical protein